MEVGRIIQDDEIPSFKISLIRSNLLPLVNHVTIGAEMSLSKPSSLRESLQSAF